MRKRVYVLSWHNHRLNDSGIIGVFATQKLAIKAAEENDNQYHENPDDIEALTWNESQTEGFRPTDDHHFTIERSKFVSKTGRK